MKITDEYKNKCREAVRRALSDKPNASISELVRAVQKETGKAPASPTIKGYIADIAGKTGVRAKVNRQRDLNLTVIPMQNTEENELSKLVRMLHSVMRRTNVSAIHITVDGGVKITHSEEYHL